MAEIWTMGEMIVEIMREKENEPLDKAGVFRGPYPSGAPAIFIDTVARLGHKGGIIGGVGKDDFGKCLLDRLKSDGVDVSHVIENQKKATGCAIVTYFDDGSRKFIFHMGNTPAVEAKAPQKDVLDGVRYFHVMGCSLFADIEFAKEILKAAQTAKKIGAKVSFDPNIRKELIGEKETDKILENLMRLTNVFLPGEEELLLLTGKETVEEAVEECFKNPELEILALKQGSRGSKIYTKEKTVETGIYRIQPVDATGAGDSFDAAFICGLCEGKRIEEAAKMAAAAGAINTAAFGPMEGKISVEAIDKMIKELPV